MHAGHHSVASDAFAVGRLGQMDDTVVLDERRVPQLRCEVAREDLARRELDHGLSQVVDFLDVARDRWLLLLIRVDRGSRSFMHAESRGHRAPPPRAWLQRDESQRDESQWDESQRDESQWDESQRRSAEWHEPERHKSEWCKP